MFVGEQPGDQEDRAASRSSAPPGSSSTAHSSTPTIDRKTTYVTNAVKHFKWEPRGKRRIHKKPNELEIGACHQWLERELALLRPALVVALGATAARAVFGRATAIEKNRGHIIAGAQAKSALDSDLLVTVHPSFLLRVPDADRDAAYRRFVADLKLIRPYAS